MPTAVTVVVAVAAAAAAAAVTTAPTADASGGSPPRRPSVPAGYPLFPLALQPLLMPAVRAREAPFLFRTTAAIFASWWDCVVPYVGADGEGGGAGGTARVRDSFGLPPRVAATARAANVHSMGRCAAAATAVLAGHLLSAAAADAYYARAAALGTPLPREGACRRDAAARPDEAACYGVAVARRLIWQRLTTDGFNEAGTDTGPARGAPNGGGGVRGRRPFRDVRVGHTPVNTPWQVRLLLRWTPLEEDPSGAGTYVTQRATAPQASVARPYLLPRSALAARRVAAPYPHAADYAPDFTCGGGGGPRDRDGVCGLAAAAAAAVATTAGNARRAALVPHFDDKTRSLAPLPAAVATAANLSYPAFVAMEFAANAGIYDALTVVWAEKLRHDAVRPATLVPRILPSWGGGVGGGAAFVPTIRTMPHSEYPSGSSCFCRVFTDALAAFVPRGRWPRLAHTFPAGHPIDGGAAAAAAAANRPGGTRPAAPRVLKAPLTVTWRSLRAVADDCSASRLWGGLHFPPAVAAGEALCEGLGAAAVRVVACMARGVPGVPRCEED